jgi:hypothetical protein
MKATFSSETSVDFQRNARRYIPEDRTLQVYVSPKRQVTFCQTIRRLNLESSTRQKYTFGTGTNHVA